MTGKGVWPGAGRDGAEGWSQKDIQKYLAAARLQLPRPGPRLPSAPPLSAPEDFLRMGVGFSLLSGCSDAAPICLQAGLEQGSFTVPHLQGGPRHVLVLTSFQDLRPCAAAHAGGSPFISSSQRLPWRPAGAPATQQTCPSSSQAAAANGTLSAYSADEEIAIKGG